MDTNDHIRRKYRLPKDVPIRHAMPSSEEMATEPSILIRVAEALGYEEWMWRSLTGKVLAVIILAPAISGIFSWWKPKLELAYELLEPYVRALSIPGIRPASELVAFRAPRNGSLSRDHAVEKIIAPRFHYPVEPEDRINLWRLTHARYSGKAFAPSSTLFDSKWFPAGTSVIYAADSLMHAIIEARVYLPSLPTNLVAIRASLPTHVSKRLISRSDSSNRDRMEIGNTWLSSEESCLLMVPSASDPHGITYLVNARHPDASSLVVEEMISLPELKSGVLI